jgi:Mce-associated membrane protein
VPKSSLRSRPGAGVSGQRSMSAAARAAAKRAAKADDQRSAVQPLAPAPVPEQASAPKDTSPSDPVAEREVAAGSAGRRNSLLSAMFAVLLVAGVVAGALLANSYRHDERTQRASTQALLAARAAAPVILSYDYRHLDQDFAAALSHLTGPFRDEYRKTTSTVVAPTATKYHGVVKATVAQPTGGKPAAAVVSASPDKVVVLLFMNQVTRSTRLDAPRLDLDRVRMTLAHTAAGWKVSAVGAL